MRFINKKKPGWTLGFYVFTLTFVGVGLLLLFMTIQFVALPKEWEVDVGQTPGRTYVREEVTPGTFKISVPWEKTEAWGADSISLISFDNFLKKLKVESWRPDQSTQGVFEYSTRVVKTPIIGFMQLVPVSLSDGVLVVQKELVLVPLFGLIIVTLLAGILSFGFFSEIKDP